MKRFAVFNIEFYYPNGGMNDFYKSYDTLEEAMDYVIIERGLIGYKLLKERENCNFDCQVWDMIEVKKVFSIYE